MTQKDNTTREFNTAFQRVLGRVLIVAGVGTASGMSIVGGCVPADCGEFDDEPRYFMRNDDLEEEVARALGEYTANNPDASARERLEHLYGMESGLYDPNSQFTDVAITLLGEVAAEESGLNTETCDRFCGYYQGAVTSCEVVRDKETQDASLLCTGADSSGCVGGREPAGLSSSGAVQCDDPRGEYWAYICHLEACAVHAFAALHDELQHHGAPESLLRKTLHAMHDEIVHVKLTAALARRYGAEPVAADVDRPAVRPLMELALENAREGCVREAFGALEMHVQSQLSDDPQVAAVFSRIATDETFHAQLSWEIDQWIRLQLPEDSRSHLDEARHQALGRLRQEVNNRQDNLVRAVKIPSAAQATQLLNVLEEELLAA